MAVSIEVLVGQVSARSDARLHLLNQAGRPQCGTVGKSAASQRNVTDADGPSVCHRCREALRTAVTRIMGIRERRALSDLRGSAGNAIIIEACDRLIDGLETDEDRLAHEEFLRVSREPEMATAGIAPSNPAWCEDETLTLF